MFMGIVKYLAGFKIFKVMRIKPYRYITGTFVVAVCSQIFGLTSEVNEKGDITAKTFKL